MADPLASEPLLAQSRGESEGSSLSEHYLDTQAQVAATVRGWRAEGRHLLFSRKKHYFVMSLVTLDVAALLLNVFVRLIACEVHMRKEPWVKDLSNGLEIAGLVFSCLFMAELIACLLAFGPRYLNSWFHVFDSLTIVISFAIDVATHGAAIEIGSLVIVLRLWRLAKMSEEIVVGASERIGDLEQRNQELSDEIKRLKSQMDMAQ